MSLSSLNQDAFFEVVKCGSFSKAAKKLHISQPALSQRVLNLEESLGVTLLVREPRQVRVTPFGERLLRYCQIKETLEAEVLGEIEPSTGTSLCGRLVIASYSSIMRSVIIPALSPLLRQNPRLECQFIVCLIPELDEILRRSEADLVISDHRLPLKGVVAEWIGRESHVAVEDKKLKPLAEVFLDVASSDNATQLFFQNQSRSPRYRRVFMGDIYGILDGVEQGLGRAVVSRHLIRERPRLKLLGEYKPRSFDVFLHYYGQSFYTRSHIEVTKALIKRARRRLGK